MPVTTCVEKLCATIMKLEKFALVVTYAIMLTTLHQEYFAVGAEQIAIPRSTTPSRIARVRAFMVGFKQANLGRNNDYYTLRVSWTEPYFWNDDENEKSRGYNLNCYIENLGSRGPNLVNIPVSYEYQGYSEKFQFPADFDLQVQCAVQARNSKNVLGDWAYATKIRVNDVPIYLPGFDGINVKGFSQQEIDNLKARINAAAANASTMK